MLNGGGGRRSSGRGGTIRRLPLGNIGTTLWSTLHLARGGGIFLSRCRTGRAGSGKFGETVERTVLKQPIHTRIRMEMQEGGEFGRGEVVSGDHGWKLSHVRRPGNP